MPRPRKPTRLKVIQNTARLCRLNPDEPLFDIEIPAPPEHLSDRAKMFWKTIADILTSKGIVAAVDACSLESMAETYSEMVAARLKLRDKGGPTYETTNQRGDKMFRAYPEVAIVSDCDRRLCAWYARFGMTPADRSRVAVDPGAKDQNPFEKIG